MQIRLQFHRVQSVLIGIKKASSACLTDKVQKDSLLSTAQYAMSVRQALHAAAAAAA